jgi:outer membrane protein
MMRAEIARRLAPLIAGFVACLLLPGYALGETLAEAYKLAHQNDPKYQAALAESRASGTAIDQARAGFLPSAKLDIDKLDTRQRILSSNNPIFGAGVTTFATDRQTLSVTQPIFRKDVIERFAQAKAVVRQAELTALAAEQELLLRTTAAYLSVLAASDSLALAQAEREAVGKALDLAREKLRMGLGTITSQYDAAARHAITQAREIEAQNKHLDAKQGLREITEKMIENFQSLREEFTLETPDPANQARWVEAALEQNLPLRARREAIEVAYQEMQRQLAGHFPSLNLVFSHNRNNAGSTLFGGGSNVETSELTLRLSVPIYEGGLTNAVSREAAYRYQKAREEYEQERRAVERATRAAYDGTLSGANLVRALKQSVVSQEGALELKEFGYRSGLFTLLPVLDAQRDLYLAKRDYAQARYDYLLYRLRLKQAAGSLSENDLVSAGAALQ